MFLWCIGHCLIGAADGPRIEAPPDPFAEPMTEWSLPLSEGGELGLAVRLPTGPGERPPVVIFSHGFAASGFGYAGLASVLGERGYLVLAPHHADGELGEDARRGPLAALLRVTRPEARARRVAEVRRVLAAVMDPDSVVATVDPDRERIVLIGHSLGASTVLELLGQRSDLDARAVDARIAAAVVISLPAPGFLGLHEDSWRDLRGPVLAITGTQDTTIGTADWRDRLTIARTAPPGAVHSLVLEGLRHHELGDYSFFGRWIRRDHRLRAIAFTVIADWLDHVLGREPAAWYEDGFRMPRAELSRR